MRTGLGLLARRARDGWLATGAGGPLVAASWLLRREYLVTARATDSPLGGAALPGGVRWVRLEDPARLPPASRHPAIGRAEARRRLDEGQECWTGWIGGELAHWRWETTRDAYLPYLDRTLRPQPGDLVVLDVFTEPRHRGRGLHTASTLLALGRARDAGLGRLVGMVAWWNRPARHVIEVKTGRSVVGSVGYWSAGGRRRYFARGLVRLEPDGVLALGPAARPPGAGLTPERGLPTMAPDTPRP